MPFCDQCGAPYNEGASFCENCGKALTPGKPADEPFTYTGNMDLEGTPQDVPDANVDPGPEPDCLGLSIAGLVLSVLFQIVGIIICGAALYKIKSYKGETGSKNRTSKILSICGIVAGTVILVSCAVLVVVNIGAIITWLAPK